MNPTATAKTHSIFQKVSQTKSASPQKERPPLTQGSHPLPRQPDDKEKYAKKKVQEAFRKALRVWHTNPNYQGKEYRQLTKVVAEMFPNLPQEDF